MEKRGIIQGVWDLLKALFLKFNFFFRPRLYKIALIDLCFLIGCLILGYSLSLVPKTFYAESILANLFLLFATLFSLVSFYLMLKLLFYRLIKKHTPFKKLIFNQAFSLLIVLSVLLILYTLGYSAVTSMLRLEYKNQLLVSLLVFISFFAYLFFLSVQKHDNESFWRMLKACAGEMLTLRNYSILLYDLFLVIPVYMIFLLLTWLHQALWIFGKLPLPILNNTAQYSTAVLIICAFSVAMAVNKYIIFELDKDHKKINES